jgi:uncharacterized membrane protein
MIQILFLRVALQAGAVLGLMILSAGLLGRPFCFRRQLTVREARMTLASDLLIWGGSAVLLVAHAGLWFSVVGLGTWFYLANPFQIAQIVLFFLILALDVWPARLFRSWNRYLVLDQVPYFTDRDYFLVRRIWRIQAILLMGLPVFTPLVRLGIGLPR